MLPACVPAGIDSGRSSPSFFSRLDQLYLSGIWLGWLYGAFVRSSTILKHSKYVNYSTPVLSLAEG